MNSVGAYIRALREEAHLLLDDVHRETKIAISSLEAIEADQFECLGGYGYAKAMVNTLVHFLNGDEGKALILFEQAYPHEKGSRFKPRTPIKENKILISTNFLYGVGIVLLIVFLGFIVVRAYDSYQQMPGSDKGIFHRTRIQNEAAKTQPMPKVVEKPDTVRIKQQQAKNKLAAPVTAKNQTVKKTTVVADTTDYTNLLLFHNQDSPLNIRN
jgi:cytoskeletal protein RodZ